MEAAVLLAMAVAAVVVLMMPVVAEAMAKRARAGFHRTSSEQRVDK